MSKKEQRPLPARATSGPREISNCAPRILATGVSQDILSRSLPISLLSPTAPLRPFANANGSHFSFLTTLHRRVQIPPSPSPNSLPPESESGNKYIHILQVSQLYKYNFLTPRDSYLHFKHVLHRRIATANRFADDPTCRFCGIAPESSTHIATCIATEPVFEFMDRDRRTSGN